PGGFVGGISADNVLTQRFSRYPALADASRALGLVDKQGVGVDRMYREMVTIGHRPPLLVEEPGPRVRVRLAGGQPLLPIIRLTSKIQPAARQRDVQIALIVHTLLRNPFTTVKRMSKILQRTTEEAAEALEIAHRCVVDGQPLISPLKNVWTLSNEARRIVGGQTADRKMLQRQRVLWFITPGGDAASEVVSQWFEVQDRISSGDYSKLTGLTLAGARGALDRLVQDGRLVRGDATGRNAHYLQPVNAYGLYSESDSRV
ncbi:MAG: DUF5635 domain-containing protein, partial [Brevibacterium aurantiacum]